MLEKLVRVLVLADVTAFIVHCRAPYTASKRSQMVLVFNHKENSGFSPTGTATKLIRSHCLNQSERIETIKMFIYLRCVI